MGPRDFKKEGRFLEHVLANSTKGDANSVVKTIDDWCWSSKGNWMMNVGDVKGVHVDDAISEHKPMVVLELGTYCGYSSVRMGRLLPEGAKLISLDVCEKTSEIAR